MNQPLPFPHRTQQPLSEYSTFGIGGPARYFTEVSSCEEMQRVLAYVFQHQIPLHILGKGSNTLFADRGFNGLVVLNRMESVHQEGGLFSVGSGYSFAQLGTLTARAGWGGLEFASGIPGSVGGAIYMNAGAQGKSTAEVVAEVDFISEEGEWVTLARDALAFGYRTSPFQQRRGAIVQARFMLTASPSAKEVQQQLVYYRMKTQPYKEKSAGCVFRNPPGESAGRLIDAAGLKGMQVGGAMVSSLHANFIVNGGGATAQDVLTLISAVQEAVYAQRGIELTPELCYVPYDRV